MNAFREALLLVGGFVLGALDVVRGKPWRTPIDKAAAAAYTDKVWSEGGENLSIRERHFHEVGATFGGLAISELEHKEKCDTVVKCLDLLSQDVVCDVCCGNGMITSELAKVVKLVVGVDFSSALLRTARAFYSAKNIRYEFLDLMKRDGSVLAKYPRINKVCFHSCLQYYSDTSFKSLLLFLRTFSRGGPLKIFIGGVPDKQRKFHFYKTARQRCEYLKRLAARDVDVIGTWWTREQLIQLTKEVGGSCVCIQQTTESTRHYRFDAVLSFPAERELQ